MSVLFARLIRKVQYGAAHQRRERGKSIIESKQGRMVDALAHSGEEGRDKLREAAVRCK